MVAIKGQPKTGFRTYAPKWSKNPAVSFSQRSSVWSYDFTEIPVRWYWRGWVCAKITSPAWGKPRHVLIDQYFGISHIRRSAELVIILSRSWKKMFISHALSTNRKQGLVSLSTPSPVDGVIPKKGRYNDGGLPRGMAYAIKSPKDCGHSQDSYLLNSINLWWRVNDVIALSV